MPRRHGLAFLVTLCAGAVVTPATAGAASDDALVPPPAAVPGFTANGGGAKVARDAAGGRTSKALKGGQVAGSAYRAGTQRLSFGAFVAGSSSRASRALSELGKGGKTIKLGDGARLRVTASRKSADAVVIVRVGTGVGAVRLRVAGSKQSAAASSGAQAQAAQLVARLRRTLALTAYQRVLGGIADDGSITPQLALQAFSLTYGRLPGVRLPAGPSGAPWSGTGAMHLVARVWAKLTPAQRKAIDDALGAPHDESSPPVARSASLTENPAYEAVAAKYVTYYAGRLPTAGAVPIKVFDLSTELSGGKGKKTLADSIPVDAAGKWGAKKGPTAYCRIRVTPSGKKSSAAEFEFIMAHEVFHCFQFALAPTLWESTPFWIIEGMASWAAWVAYPPPVPVALDEFKDYVKSPAKPLFARDYDAMGFWARADEVGGGAGTLFPKVPSLLTSGDSTASAIIAGATSLAFQETWASAVRRYAGAGSAWNQLLPYSVSSASVPTPASPIAGNASLSVGQFAMREYDALKSGAKPLINLVPGKGTLRAGTTETDYGTSTAWFCMGTCECPPEYDSTIPDNQQVTAAKLALALTGGDNGGSAKVTYHAVKEFCKKSKKKPPPGPAESNGDPHLTSLDGLHFDYQAAGEFALVRSSSGDLEIQARQEPYQTSTTVTVNTQIGLRIGGRRVTVSPGLAATDSPRVRVDGAPQPLPAGADMTLAPGATLSRDPEIGTVTASWPDGSNVAVRPVGKWGVSAHIELADARRRAVTGLLGNFDGNPGNELAARNGKRIAYTALASSDWGLVKRSRVKEEFTKKFFNALYDDVGDSWRIAQPASLLDYGSGESTKTFTDRSIPERPVDPDEVAAKKRAAAEKVCRDRGVTLPGPLADCITDVVATGNAAFADDAFFAQQAAQVTWRRLDGGGDRISQMSLLETGDGLLHIAFEERTGPSAYRMVDVPLDGAGREGATETINAVDSEPLMFTGPDGGARVEAAELPSGAPSGIYQYARGADGAWAPLGPVSTEGASYVGRPVGLFLGDGTLLSLSPMTGGAARLFRGTGTSNPGVDANQARPDCYSSAPAFTRDGASGAVWVAWSQWNCSQTGLFVEQIDPATLAPIGPPTVAPGTLGNADAQSLLGLDDRVALTGRPGLPGVFMAYKTPDENEVRLWRVGEPTAKAVKKRQSDIGTVRLVAEPSGGALWLGWIEGGRLWIDRANADGVLTGSPRPVDPPPKSDPPFFNAFPFAIAARPGALDVVFGVRRQDTRPGALWHARLEP